MNIRVLTDGMVKLPQPNQNNKDAPKMPAKHMNFKEWTKSLGTDLNSSQEETNRKTSPKKELKVSKIEPGIEILNAFPEGANSLKLST